MNNFLFNLINKIFFIPIAVQRKLLAKLDKFYAWFNPLPRKDKIQFKIVFYSFLVGLAINLKLTYDLWFGDPSYVIEMEKDLTPIELYMGLWACYFTEIVFEQPIFVNIKFTSEVSVNPITIFFIFSSY